MLDPTVKRGIIAGVIAWFITLIFLQPLVNLSWAGTQAIASSFSRSFLDAVYQRAAQGDTHQIDLQFLGLFTALWWGFTTGLIVSSVTQKLGRKSAGGDVITWVQKNFWFVIAVLMLGAVDGGVSSARHYAEVQFNASFHQR